MKKMFDAAIIIGFILIVGGAGGFETMSISFGKCMTIVVSGVFLSLFGCYGKSRKLYCTKKLSKHQKRRKIKSAKVNQKLSSVRVQASTF